MEKVKLIHVTKRNIRDLFFIVDETRFDIPVHIVCDDIQVIESVQDLQLIIDIIDMCMVPVFELTCRKVYFQGVHMRNLSYNLTDDGHQIYIYS